MRSKEREELIRSNVDWARKAAYLVTRKRVAWDTLDEYKAQALEQLVRAADSWDPSRGVPFRRYALRQIQWRLIDVGRLTGDLARPYRGQWRSSRIPTGMLVYGSSDKMGEAPRALDRVQAAQLAGRALAAVPERWRSIVWAHFVEGELLKDIGRRLGVGESRVCQIVGAARKLMKAAAGGDLG